MDGAPAEPRCPPSECVRMGGSPLAERRSGESGCGVRPSLSHSARAVLCLLGASLLPYADAYAAGYEYCSSTHNWPCHGTNLAGNPGTFRLTLLDASGAAVAGWTAGQAYKLKLASTGTGTGA